uniref:MPN domain-containing protein n=1 Tax=Helicotheca tamesis TaxID=374047 RepID=A0A7S2GWV2_9STRA|mmetsp:Transcript_12972/g.17825  ORF Transcript_12972/g.17825 Transcript_12972/m.17825 type:complete len:493 (+) Transcript_12972:181-1659(+)|eukprot:CAMPEP_0185731080 /NCGR_PEP_ID=MMETSP1171-20130828/11852_1 /TAXON_ID=374046 /ORGANISM="Helicotheca tamensis, Strain CCMP826" /LENGTH=492 /DNA_ID=CAMNT_0028400265 /DNA_START=83 /DNA_END=1561 /DNA_ORIENTATION=-
MLIRVRTNVGIWRVDNLDGSSTIANVKEAIAKTRPHVKYEKPLSTDPACSNPLEETATLDALKLAHGSMIHCRVDPATCADVSTADTPAANTTDSDDKKPTANMRRIIDKDGTIKMVHCEDPDGPNMEKGFRKGMQSLRAMKMHWTLQEFVDMDSQFEFKIKRQEESWVGKGGVSVDSPSANDFQSYLRRFNFQRQRFGFLYGKFVDEDDEDGEDKKKDSSKMDFSSGEKKDEKEKKNQKVVVEAIYEPPQEADPDAAEGFVMLDDPFEDQVENLASLLGLRKVGWIFGHPPREEGFQLSAAEVIMAAELQLEAAGGVEQTPFVTVKVTVGDDGNVSFEAFQVSRQCMEMVAEQALEIGPNPGFCYVNETFTAIQEGKPSKTVENNFFLTVVPIVQHVSETFVTQFPKANRDHDDRTQSHDEMKRQLSKSGSSGWTFIDLLSDFALLLYLCQFLDVNTDIPKICDSVVNRDVPLDDGYKIIISSLAGMDGSY